MQRRNRNLYLVHQCVYVVQLATLLDYDEGGTATSLHYVDENGETQWWDEGNKDDFDFEWESDDDEES